MNLLTYNFGIKDNFEQGGIVPLTRALVGSFYNAIWWGGGLFLAPPRISGTTGPIYKTQAAFDSPGQFIEQK